jgi:hypothetical protein
MRSVLALWFVLAAACGSKSSAPATTPDPEPTPEETPPPDDPPVAEGCDEGCAAGCSEVEDHDGCMDDCGCGKTFCDQGCYAGCMSADRPDEECSAECGCFDE